MALRLPVIRCLHVHSWYSRGSRFPGILLTGNIHHGRPRNNFLTHDPFSGRYPVKEYQNRLSEEQGLIQKTTTESVS